MPRHKSLRLAVSLLLAATVFPIATRAQSQGSQQSDSVAEAARRAREQKKAAESRPAPVITNDTLKPAAPAPAAPGAASAPDTNASSSAPSNQAAPAPASSEEANKDAKQKASAELEDLKKQVADAQQALDLAKRELSLEQDNVFSKPNYQSDTAGKAKLDGLQQDVTDKQQALDTLKARLAEAQEKAGAEAPAAQTPPSSPQF